MIRAVLVSALLGLATAADATPRDDVLAAVATALRAINTHDAARFEQVMLPGAIITAQSYDSNGKLTTAVLTVAEMAKRIGTLGHKVEESIQAPTVQIQRDLAHVWAPYTLDYDDKRLHCGVDSFGLARVNGAWRLTSLTWTAEPQGCPG